MTNTINIPLETAKVFAEFFEDQNPHHLVVKAVFAAKHLRELLDAPVLDERAAFEASFRRRHPGKHDDIDLARDENGDYKYQPASVEWPVWNASAERYRPAPMPTDTALRRAGLFLSGMDERYAHCNEMKTLRALIDIAQSHSDMLDVKPKGRCVNGDYCLCGGDTAGVRAQCHNWIKP